MDFQIIADYFDKIEKVSSRLEITDILKELLLEADEKNIDKLVYMLQGSIAPNYDPIDLGMADKMIINAVEKMSGFTKKEIEKHYLKVGDLGEVAEEFISKRTQKALFSDKLTMDKVYNNLFKISNLEGSGSQDTKIKLFAELLNSASPNEAKYVVRIALGNLRLGLGDSTIIDALALILLDDEKDNKKLHEEIEDYEKLKDVDKLRKVKYILSERIDGTYNNHANLGDIAKNVIKHGLAGLEKTKITTGVPIRSSLAERMNSAEDIVEKLGKCAVEVKIDGFRLQIHKNKDEVILFTRGMEDMSETFPEIVDAVRKNIKAEKAIFEGEAIAYDFSNEKLFTFQETIQRKRKYGIEEMAKKFPLKFFVFDIMSLEGKNTMNKKFTDRRDIVEKLIKKNKIIEPIEQIITDDPIEIQDFFEDALKRNLEGIIAKDLDAKYIAGARKFSWIKLKKSYQKEMTDTVDAVILGYYKGKGKRAKFGLGILLTGVYDKKSKMYKTIAKVGSGLTEKDMDDLEEKLKKFVSKTKPKNVDSDIKPDFWVEPKFVVELNADEISLSPLHTCGREMDDKSGYALRFPRYQGLREKKPEDATTVTEIKRLFDLQGK